MQQYEELQKARASNMHEDSDEGLDDDGSDNEQAIAT
jgi:hypothetical protein